MRPQSPRLSRGIGPLTAVTLVAAAATLISLLAIRIHSAAPGRAGILAALGLKSATHAAKTAQGAKAGRRSGRTRAPAAAPAVSLERISLVAVGDVLPHYAVKDAAAAHPMGFQGLWAGVRPLFRDADLAFANLETPIAPRTGKPGYEFVFNAPARLARDLARSGIDVVSVANNHAYDQGRRGLAETLGHLRGAGVAAIGAAAPGAGVTARPVPVYVNRNGIRVALLAVTDLLNIRAADAGAGPTVSTLDEAATLAAVRAARRQADAVVISVHWGEEYQTAANARQKRLAAALVGAGADVVLGHHPHVLQPLAMVESQGRRGIIAYSLGNFVSNMAADYSPTRNVPAAGDRRDAVALRVVLGRVKGAGSGRTEVVDAEYIPLWVDNRRLADGRRHLQVVPVEAAIADTMRQMRRTAGARMPVAPAGLTPDLRALEERLRLLLLRRDRIRGLTGR